MYCPECRANYPQGTLFCARDGARLAETEGGIGVTPGGVGVTPRGVGVTPGGSSPVPLELVTGQVLDDKFEIAGHLGSGGMGQVYKARALEHDCWVALKVLSAGLAREELAKRRFQREARVISQLRHPHTVRVVSHGDLLGGVPYMAMEHIEGESLEALIQRGPVEWKRALGIIDMISQSLEEAHGLGIIHRDIKPANIMFEKRADGTSDYVKVLDFGIAKVESQSTELTHRGMVVGTPSYLAPEQAKGYDIDHRVDIYSLGVTLFEMLTAERPFQASAIHVLIFKHVHEAPPLMGEKYDYVEMPQPLDELVQCMLAKAPKERPPNLVALRSALAHMLKQPAQPARSTWPGPTANPEAEEQDDTALVTRRAIEPLLDESQVEFNFRDTGDNRVWVPSAVVGGLTAQTEPTRKRSTRGPWIRWAVMVGLLMAVAVAVMTTYALRQPEPAHTADRPDASGLSHASALGPPPADSQAATRSARPDAAPPARDAAAPDAQTVKRDAIPSPPEVTPSPRPPARTAPKARGRSPRRRPDFNELHLSGKPKRRR